MEGLRASWTYPELFTAGLRRGSQRKRKTTNEQARRALEVGGVENRLPDFGSSGFPVGKKPPSWPFRAVNFPRNPAVSGVQFQSSAVKVDGDLHVLAIADTIGVFFQ